MPTLANLLVIISILGLTSSVPLQDANVERWCGKAYKASDPAIDPGGRIEPPAYSKTPLLDLKIQPRHSLYLPSDSDGAFVIDTSLSYIHGQAYGLESNVSAFQIFAREYNESVSVGTERVSITITRADTGKSLVSTNVPMNKSDNLVEFPVGAFEPSLKPYEIQLAAKSNGGQVYKAKTSLHRLPAPKDGGSATRIDNLYNAMLVQQKGQWTPLLPYSFYMGSGSFDKPSDLADFKALGYNMIHMIPPYPLEWFDTVIEEADKLGLWVMYDMRHTYQSKEQVTEQITRYKKRKSLLLWYTADEPDGVVDALDATKKSYDLIKSIDPYHPVSLVLNCENYNFEKYSSGADILLSDVYPIGNDNDFSTEYHTVCNTTYGCCGCDNCFGKDDLTNVPARLDKMSLFQTQLGQSQKPLWSVPQAFGAAQFWRRVPTGKEEVAMTMLGINHGAKGVVMWTYPTTPELKDATSKLAKALTQAAAKWILGAKHVQGLKVSAGTGIDASAWIDKEEALICVINPSHKDQKGGLTLQLPDGVIATGVGESMWGDGAWRIGVQAQTGSLVAQQMSALGVELFTIKIKTDKAGTPVGVVRPDNVASVGTS